MAISQANRKTHEEFLEKTNKTFPNKRKEIKIYISITEE
jgi:hypothetical protein